MTNRAALALASLAAAVASAGDFLLIEAALRPAVGSDVWLRVGTWLGVLAIPLYAVGYAGVARLIGSDAGRDAMRVRRVGAYAAALGAVVHGMTGLATEVSPTRGTALDDPVAALLPYVGYFGPLWGLLGACALIGSLAFARAVRKGRTLLPRWMSIVNPLAITLAIALASLPFDRAAVFLVPAAPNLAHLAFFAACCATLRSDPGASAARRPVP